ncbi:phosphatidylinositol-4- kinase [Apophysomyces ossiformis]|uniref:1-phosphatidylinositol 4-kinase n=1 Tax=Apophysomyces ossiformis TaxID=679940 RepID=A0A8H7BP24_9FUNG|nr:phosphatidylinositol-4- kinase [Apophysomyces ossiformis]
MNGLDFDLHSQILMGLAEVLADSRAKATDDDIERLVAKCPPVPLDSPDADTIFTQEDTLSLDILTRRCQQSLAALVKYAASTTKDRQLELLPRLLAYVRYLPAYEWEETILYKDLPPSDMITYSLVSGLLEIGYKCPEVYDRVIAILWKFGECIIHQLAKGDVKYTVTFLLPALAGLARALQLSPYLHKPNQLLALCQNTQPLIQDETLDHIRVAITTCLKEHDATAYSRRVLQRYWEEGVPLSSNRVVHDLLIVLRNVAARVITDYSESTNSTISQKRYKSLHLTKDIERAWSTLMRNTAKVNEKSELLKKNLRGVYVMSLAYYEDIRKYAEKSAQDGKKWAPDAYMQEILGTSLHVAALSSIYLHEVDDVLINHISQCLFDVPQVADPWVHVAALDAAVLLAINFTHLNGSMTNTICRFLATPSPVFELQTTQDGENLTVQQFAIVRLAQCIKPQSQMHQAAISTLYALLNEITRYTEEESATSNERFSTSFGGSNVISGAPAVNDLSEKQKQQVCANALSAIVGVAVYLRDEAIMAQALSMLVLRRKTLSTAATTQLTRKLVDLALVSPLNVFTDIINLFSTLGRESFMGDNRQLSDSIMGAQLRLASELSARPEYYHTYLINILTLFVENGNSIQRTLMKTKKDTEYPLAAKLGTLLPVLKELLQHKDFNPHLDPSEEIVTLFRNAWFHCVLFGFVTESMWIREWHDSMLVIAKKTPVLVIESATTYLESDLEYNSVLRGGNTAEHNLASMRQKLTSFLPSLSYDIRYFSFAQVIFVLSVYHIEMMRSRMGDCSYVLRYFMNEGVNSSSLANCLETIADRVTATFIKDSSSKAVGQVLDDDLSKQVASLLQLCCHRLNKVHQMALRTTDRIVTSFPQVFAEKSLITLLLELVQLLWLSCEAEYIDEYCPIFHFTSPRVGVTLELGDSFAYRKEICTRFYESTKKWLRISMDRAPLEVGGLLQDYLAEFDRYSSGIPADASHLGRSLALEVGKSYTKEQFSHDVLPKVSSLFADNTSNFVNGFTSRRFYTGEIRGIEYIDSLSARADKLCDIETGSGLEEQVPVVLEALSALFAEVRQKKKVPVERLHRTLHRAAGFIISLPNIHPDLVHYVVCIPVYLFTPEALDIATSVWNWILVERPETEKRLMVEMLGMWSWAQKHRKGLFSPILNVKHPFVSKMTYVPSDKAIRDSNQKAAVFLFSPHVTWTKFLSSRFYAIRHRSKHLVNMFVRLLQESFQNAHLMSTHPLARYARFQLLRLGMKILQSTKMEALAEHKFRTLVYDAAFNWFSLEPRWHYGARKTLALMDYKLLTEFYNAVSNDMPSLSYLVTSSPLKNSNSKIASGLYMFLNDKTKDDVIRQHQLAKKLLMLFLESELSRLSVWCNPLNAVSHGHPAMFTGNTEKSMVMEDAWKEIVRFAWETSPRLAVMMNYRFLQPVVHRELHRLIANNSLDVVDVPEALVILLGEKLQPNAKLDLKYLQYWAAVPAITAANYFLPAYNNHPLILQYAMRSLEYYPVDTVFFYIPQVVQALRYDELGYVEKYILEAGQVSQLFAHQIIWNMQANFYIDADKDCSKPDALKPTLERIIDTLVASFTGADREFYEREFKFFNEVTAISGYLKEYIKYGQNEKKPLQKKRLDEELAKIKVDIGVYLPSNPDGHVVDINRTSGRPLQSHAKAPFMATFKIEKEVESTEVAIIDEDAHQKKTIQTWQGAIFKVGDDCRQDVLALQLIAVFKNIFTSIGLDLYVYPYRVVATAPGRGVIDVIPRSISRDQLGREKVNSLFDYFVAKYGSPDSIHFQRARINFVQSVAAYSVISYLLQIKDRHNGNIMLDDDGHIIHIDFGFIFDIAPGGITFESSPFKLTAEMIQVMGGGSEEQAFKQFSELVIKAYLACRPYAELIMQLVTLMLQSGLPCFRGETIKKMRTRFQVDKSERAAADFMMMRIKDSFENQRTVLYDYFQKLTNGIPY